MNKGTEIYIFNVEITTKTGLHIGGSKDAYEVGGLDNSVIKDPVTKEPYIPGSSLKGKLRHLLEKNLGLVHDNGVCTEDKDGYPIATLFGKPAETNDDKYAVSRLIVRDFFVKKEGLEVPKVLFEIKTENMINRSQGRAEHPRPMERVVRGVTFEGKILLNIYEEDSQKEKDMLKCFLLSLELLKENYLGGCGSRGYGAVDIKITKVTKLKYPEVKEENIELDKLKKEVGLQ